MWEAINNLKSIIPSPREIQNSGGGELASSWQDSSYSSDWGRQSCGTTHRWKTRRTQPPPHPTTPHGSTGQVEELTASPCWVGQELTSCCTCVIQSWHLPCISRWISSARLHLTFHFGLNSTLYWANNMCLSGQSWPLWQWRPDTES